MAFSVSETLTIALSLADNVVRDSVCRDIGRSLVYFAEVLLEFRHVVHQRFEETLGVERIHHYALAHDRVLCTRERLGKVDDELRRRMRNDDEIAIGTRKSFGSEIDVKVFLIVLFHID